MSIIYHKNGRTAWNGSIAYHDNGRFAWNGAIAYHDNGRFAWNGSIAYHDNGRFAWNGSTAYHDDGRIAGSEGIEIELGPGIRMYAGRSGFRLYVLGNCVASSNSSNNQETYNESSNNDNHHIEYPISKCSYCGDTYKDGDGYYAYLRPHNNKNPHSSKKFNFCSIECFNGKLENGWIRVNEFGQTEEEGKKPASSADIERLDQAHNRYIIKQSREEAEKELKETRKLGASIAACGSNHIDNSFTRKANHLESLLNETYPDRLKALEKSEKDAQRKKRANELRSQGKNIQAFVLEFQNILISLSVFLVAGLFFLFFIQNKESNKADAMKIHSELELIEDSVKIYINNKNYDKALLLTNKLVHSSHEDMEHLEFDAWSGYPKFDEYWTKKREEYKNIIFEKGFLNSEQNNTEKPKVEKKEQQEEESPIENNEPIHNKNEGIDNQDGLDDEYKN